MFNPNYMQKWLELTSLATALVKLATAVILLRAATGKE